MFHRCGMTLDGSCYTFSTIEGKQQSSPSNYSSGDYLRYELDYNHLTSCEFPQRCTNLFISNHMQSAAFFNGEVNFAYTSVFSWR